MKTIDEEIWSYIDGSCSTEESKNIADKIATNKNYSAAYQELFKLNELMASEDLEEPSMSFSRNVMEAVALEIAPRKLQTKVNYKIIFGIGAFFICSLISLLIYAIANSKMTMAEFQMPELNMTFNLSSHISPLFLKIFLFFDLTLALLYFDRLLRRKNTAQ